MTGSLDTWNDSAAKQAVVEFVERTESDGVPPEERIAVFDNDGTLWCEKPMPIQADFILHSPPAGRDGAGRLRAAWPSALEGRL